MSNAAKSSNATASYSRTSWSDAQRESRFFLPAGFSWYHASYTILGLRRSWILAGIRLADCIAHSALGNEVFVEFYPSA
jgi:hypothetical protein